MLTTVPIRVSAIVPAVFLGLLIVLGFDWSSAVASPEESLDPIAELARKNFAAGFIRPPAPYEAYVSPVTGDNQTTGNKRLLGAGDQIFLELTRPHEVAPGDLFTVYRRVKKVYHPVRGDYLGDLTSVIGIVKVLRVNGGKATVKIVRSFDAMFPGDGATRQTPGQPAPASSGLPHPEGTGMIIELPPGKTLIGEGSVVYVDWGRHDGVKLGDRLVVLRENVGVPPQVIGELQVVSVEDRTATARIVRSLTPFLRGDRIAAKATFQKQLGHESASTPSSRKEALFQELREPAPNLDARPSSGGPPVPAPEAGGELPSGPASSAEIPAPPAP